ncbi:MAG: pimeloyl-ACP methyl ester esterase BioH [Arsenophonus sp.]|nr:MAG: pimeloyl-ACP methyl ester esterase BioH [Arsenophonus sp.]
MILQNKKNIIFLHGWGLNKTIWNISLINTISKYFNVYLIDIPGYGKNYNFCFDSLEKTAEYIWNNVPKKKSIWLGWSLGGLIASFIAIKYENEIEGLITVCSSPCFIEKKDWPGIKPIILNNFKQALEKNFIKTIENFLTLQSYKSNTYKKDFNQLKSVVFNHPIPPLITLNYGLEILKNSDIRNQLFSIRKPFLRIYGYLDSLVPRTIAKILDDKIPNSYSIVIKKSAHVPFISNQKEFIKILINFSKKLDYIDRF